MKKDSAKNKNMAATMLMENVYLVEHPLNLILISKVVE